MGFAVARAARAAGHEVTLIAGPVALKTPRGVRRVDVVSARDMLAAVQAELKADCFNGRDARCPSAGAAALVAAETGARSARSHSTVRVPSSRSSSNACSKAFSISGSRSINPIQLFTIHY